MLLNWPKSLIGSIDGYKSDLDTFISYIQKNVVRIMTFSDFNAHSESLFKLVDILKFNYNVVLQNCLFVYDCLKGNFPSSFEFTFNRVDESHSIKTRTAETGMLSIPRFNSTTYCLKSIYKNHGGHNIFKIEFQDIPGHFFQTSRTFLF